MDKPLQSFTPEQAELRRGGIGGSDIGAILGLCKFRGPYDVWLDKTGQAPPYEDTVDTLFGKAMEPGVRDLYALRTGRRVVPSTTLVHPVHPVVRATPDGIVDGVKTIQIKCPRFATDWGEDGTHDVPQSLWPQVTWEMAVAGVTRCDVIALIHRDIRIYPDLPFDELLFDAMRERAEAFWQEHVVPRVPPPIDATASCGDWLKEKYTEHTEAWADAGAEIEAWAQQYEKGQRLADVAEKMKREARNQLIAAIGDRMGVRGEWGRVTYRRTKDTEKLNTKQLLEVVKPTPEQIEACITTQKGFRRMVVTLQKDKAAP